MCVFEDKRLISSQGNQGHVENFFFFFCLVPVSKILHFLFPACAASRELDSKLFRLSKNLHRTCFITLLCFFSFISLSNVRLLPDLQNAQISAVCAFPPLYSQLSSPPYLFIYLRSRQLPLIFLQKLNTPVACVIISASLWQRVCTPRFFFSSIFALMLLQLLIMWR